ncbi:MAG TPA: lysylphosphatidylglycerol synthase transmembrane domain-containing protein [Candidatus Kryptonia bacterium]|nr:lysylphosphatidylglycerol synthase transmembrane domain-containing protein [Candidatus Kryptonia bacterium]
MNRTVRIVASVGLSALFLGFAVRHVDWAEALRALAGARYIYVLPMMIVAVWSLYIRAQRWQFLLRPLGAPPMKLMVAATNIGFMANMVLPLRIGEVVRAVLVSRRQQIPLSGILATVVLERIFDMFTILLLFGVSAALVPVSPQVRQWGYSLTALALVVGGTVALVRWQEALMLRIARTLLRVLPPKPREAADHFLSSFISALDVLDRPSTFLIALAWSLYVWIVIGVVYGLGILVFDLSVPLAVTSMAVTAIVAIAVAAPSAPGFVGAFQVGCVLGLAIFGVSESQAIAYSIVAHLTQFVGVVAAGLYSLWRENMSLRDVEAVSETENVTA